MNELRNFTPEQLEKLLYELKNKLTEANDAFCDAREDYERLKSWKDESFQSVISTTVGSSYAEKERNVLASNEWKQWKLGLDEARKKYFRADCNRDNARVSWETCRSLLSSMRDYKRIGF